MIPENLKKLTKEEMQIVSGGSLVGFIVYLPEKNGSPRDYYERLSRLIPAINSGLRQFNFVDTQGNPITINHFFREPIITTIRSVLKSQNEAENKAFAYIVDDLNAQEKNIIEIYS